MGEQTGANDNAAHTYAGVVEAQAVAGVACYTCRATARTVVAVRVAA